MFAGLKIGALFSISLATMCGRAQQPFVPGLKQHTWVHPYYYFRLINDSTCVFSPVLSKDTLPCFVKSDSIYFLYNIEHHRGSYPSPQMVSGTVPFKIVYLKKDSLVLVRTVPSKRGLPTTVGLLFPADTLKFSSLKEKQTSISKLNTFLLQTSQYITSSGTIETSGFYSATDTVWSCKQFRLTPDRMLIIDSGFRRKSLMDGKLHDTVSFITTTRRKLLPYHYLLILKHLEACLWRWDNNQFTHYYFYMHSEVQANGMKYTITTSYLHLLEQKLVNIIEKVAQHPMKQRPRFFEDSPGTFQKTK